MRKIIFILLFWIYQITAGDLPVIQGNVIPPVGQVKEPLFLLTYIYNSEKEARYEDALKALLAYHVNFPNDKKIKELRYCIPWLMAKSGYEKEAVEYLDDLDLKKNSKAYLHYFSWLLLYSNEEKALISLSNKYEDSMIDLDLLSLKIKNGEYKKSINIIKNADLKKGIEADLLKELRLYKKMLRNSYFNNNKKIMNKIAMKSGVLFVISAWTHTAYYGKEENIYTLFFGSSISILGISNWKKRSSLHRNKMIDKNYEIFIEKYPQSFENKMRKYLELRLTL